MAHLAGLHDLSHLTAVVTGGGVGLGLIIARALEGHGAKVYITGRRKEKLEEGAKQAAHGKIIPIVGDVTSKEDLQRVVDFITKDTGHIDLLVNNAGMHAREANATRKPPSSKTATVAEMRDYWFTYRNSQDWSDLLTTNVAAVFTTSMAFLELLDEGNKRRAEGLPTSQIVSMGSATALTRSLDSFLYGASKAAVHHLSKILGHSFRNYDIRTNVIAPGWFPTDMTVPVQKMFEGNGGAMPRELVPTQRMGNIDEMSGTILYLASKAGGYTNGTVMTIDGGFLAVNP